VKAQIALCLLLFIAPAVGQDKAVRIGQIDFFGYAGLDLNRIRAALPLHEGDELTRAASERAIQQLKQAVSQVVGREPTDVQLTCCDERGTLMVYIGLPGKSSHNIQYKPAPTGSVRLPSSIVNLYRETMDTLEEAVRKQPSEDDSQGYALSLYPPLRAKELATREFATKHDVLVRRVLEMSSDADQREIAAHVLGYAIRSKAQMAALVQASRDSDEGVRNNAVRALGVLARSSPRVAARIPAAGFVAMLNSGAWRDRNKAVALLDFLSESRAPQLLRQLRSQALLSLIEMAHWRYPNHASSARMILGRIAGIEEDRLSQLVADGKFDEIIDSLKSRR
jgi:hypothetical protein